MTGERRVFRQGCFNSVPGLSATPACSRSCVDNTTRLEDIKEAQLLFCCCTTTNCNQDFAWTSLTSPDTPEPGGEEQGGAREASWSGGLYTSLLVVCVVSIILVSVSTVAIIIHNIRARNSPRHLPVREAQEKQKYVENFLQNQSYSLPPGTGRLEDGLLVNFISE